MYHVSRYLYLRRYPFIAFFDFYHQEVLVICWNVVFWFQIPQAFNDDMKTFGLLRIVKGPMTGEILPFAPDDVYIGEYNVGYCSNLARIFNAGEQVKLIKISWGSLFYFKFWFNFTLCSLLIMGLNKLSCFIVIWQYLKESIFFCFSCFARSGRLTHTKPPNGVLFLTQLATQVTTTT